MISKKYDEKLEEPLSLGVNKGMVAGILYGISQLILFITFGLMYYLGSIFVRDNNLQVSDMFGKGDATQNLKTTTSQHL